MSIFSLHQDDFKDSSVSAGLCPRIKGYYPEDLGGGACQIFSHLNFYLKNFLNINRPSWRKRIVNKRNFKD